MTQYNRISLIGALIALAFLPLVLFAQESALPEEGLMEEIPEELLQEIEDVVPPNTVSCFDYYTFGSVQAKITSSVTNAVAGTAIQFSGKLENNNPYPIVDGALFVKIFKSRGAINDGNGPDVVDQFLVKGDIAIPANGSVPVSFQWRIPSYALNGEYSVATFFTTSRKFNLLGLSFTDDVVGNTVPFRVSGEQNTGVSFDKAGVTIAGEAYHFAAFPPRVAQDSPAIVVAKVKNTTAAPQTATVSWSVSQWDAQLRENVVQEESRQITVPAKSTSDVSITVTDTKYPVYLVTGTLRWKDTQSIIGARFVREGIDRTRINFPGVLSFPLEAGKENTLFSCLHNSGESASVSGGKLDIILLDVDGNVIHTYSYEGDITGAMMGVASSFIPKKTYDYFTLTAQLYQNGEFVDEASLTYDCNEINPGLCNATAVSATGILTSKESLIAISLGIVVLLGALWVYRRVSRRPNTTQLPPM